MTSVSGSSKEVLYIDVDDEITAIIDKVTGSSQKIIALVLPKRATVLQSIVNMKLLKRSADEAGKKLVLITSETGLMPLAGSVGLHVAKTPQSKPTIPAAPSAQSTNDYDEISEADMAKEDFDTRSNANRPIGELAGSSKEDDSFEIDNGKPVAVSVPTAKSSGSKPKKGKDKKLKVPNFGKFRNRLIIGGVLAVALLAFLIYALIAMPRATIAIGTDSEEISKTLDVTFDATADEVSADDIVVPSVVERIDRTDTATVNATGERNDGKVAEGDIVITKTVCPAGIPRTVPAGTVVVAGGQNYITQESAMFSNGNFEDGCIVTTSNSVDIIAEDAGAKYNVSDAEFSVNGHDDATASGSASGGTDKITKVVAQSDIDKANEQLDSKTDESAKDELKRRLEDRNLYVVEESFTTDSPTTDSDAEVGDEADKVTVTRKATYVMVGAREDDLNKLISDIVAQDIDSERQKVLNTGLSEAVFQLQNQQNNAAQVLMSMNTTSLVGPEINEDAIKEEVAGMKAAEAEAVIGSNPGVTSVEVTYGPFWVSSIPKNASKITITYEN